MQKVQKGFTLIELVVVIVLLGILGVTALGRFQDLSGNARTAAVEGVASEMSASSAVNYAASILGTPDFSVGSSGTDIIADGSADACLASGLGNLFSSGTLSTNYTTTSNTSDNCSTLGAGGAFNCTIADADDATATAVATIICTST